jgi:hypothetical protein
MSKTYRDPLGQMVSMTGKLRPHATSMRIPLPASARAQNHRRVDSQNATVCDHQHRKSVIGGHHVQIALSAQAPCSTVTRFGFVAPGRSSQPGALTSSHALKLVQLAMGQTGQVSVTKLSECQLGPHNLVLCEPGRAGLYAASVQLQHPYPSRSSWSTHG